MDKLARFLISLAEAVESFPAASPAAPPAVQCRARRILAVEPAHGGRATGGSAIERCLQRAAGGALPDADLLDQAFNELCGGPGTTLVGDFAVLNEALSRLRPPVDLTASVPDLSRETQSALHDASTRPRAAKPGEAGGESSLAGWSPFAALKPPLARLIESHMQERRFATGEFLMRQGEDGSSLMVLREGTIEISTSRGSKRRLITQTNRKQILGEMALVTGQPRSADVVARSPVRAHVLSAATFHKLAAEHPQMAVVLTQLVACRLGRFGRRDVLAGKELGGYQIRRHLGRGGMAVVYEADAPHPPGRVALKMMSHRLVYDRAALHQFQREADLIESFQHENIVRMYGRFSAFGTYFIVMELCRGRTLDRIIARAAPLPEDDVRRILGQTARALHYAHTAGVVHRDIKPSNMIITRQGQAMLMDFGLALPLTGAGSADDEPVAGTPRYMAPEQLEGGGADHHSDYFSLGCVAYEMLTGKPLFAETEWFDLLRRHADWDLPDLDAALGHASRELRDVVRQCLARAPQERTVDLARVAAWADCVDYIGLRHRRDGAELASRPPTVALPRPDLTRPRSSPAAPQQPGCSLREG